MVGLAVPRSAAHVERDRFLLGADRRLGSAVAAAGDDQRDEHSGLHNSRGRIQRK